MAKCKKCGAKLKRSKNFCPYCGTPIGYTAPVSEKPQTTEVKEQPAATQQPAPQQPQCVPQYVPQYVQQPYYVQPQYIQPQYVQPYGYYNYGYNCGYNTAVRVVSPYGTYPQQTGCAYAQNCAYAQQCPQAVVSVDLSQPEEEPKEEPKEEPVVVVEKPVAAPKKKVNGWSIAGFILAFFIPILGFIFSIIGVSKSKKIGRGKVLGAFGIIISLLVILCGVAVVVLGLFFEPVVDIPALAWIWKIFPVD